jgi:hypothetical protein
MSRFNNGSGKIFGGSTGSFISSIPQGVHIRADDAITHNPIIYGEAYED